MAYNLYLMKHFMQSQILPGHDAKYEVLRVIEWWQINEIFIFCASFEPNSRPVTSDVLRMVKNGNIESSLDIKRLWLSQNTVLEAVDLEFACKILYVSFLGMQKGKKCMEKILYFSQESRIQPDFLVVSFASDFQLFSVMTVHLIFSRNIDLASCCITFLPKFANLSRSNILFI